MRSFLSDRAGAGSYIRVPLVYCSVSVAYILGSSYVFGNLLGYSPEILYAEIAKGLGFIVVSSFVLWLALYREYRSGVLGETTFRRLVENLADGVFLLQVPSRKLIYANAAAMRMFGYEESELLRGNSEMLHVNGDHFSRFHEAAQGALSAGRPFFGRASGPIASI